MMENSMISSISTPFNIKLYKKLKRYINYYSSLLYIFVFECRKGPISEMISSFSSNFIFDIDTENI